MTIPFATRHDPDDVACRELTSKISLLGALCLIVMDKLFPHAITGDRLAYRFKVSDKRKTLDPVLSDLWTYGYASHTGDDNWRITDNGRQAINSLIASPAASMLALPSASQPALPMTTAPASGDFLRQPASSIDRSLIDLSTLDRSLIDQEEEQLREKIAWLDRHAVTGDKRKQAVAARACTAALLQQHLDHWTREGRTARGDEFRNKYGPLNYAVTCAISGEQPPAVSDATPDTARLIPATQIEPPAPPAPLPLPVLDESNVEGLKPTQIWQAAQGELQLQMTHATYDTWVKRTAVAAWHDDTLVVAVPNDYTRDWWQQRLQTTVNRIVAGIVGRPIAVQFVTFPQT